MDEEVNLNVAVSDVSRNLVVLLLHIAQSVQLLSIVLNFLLVHRLNIFNLLLFSFYLLLHILNLFCILLLGFL